MTNAPEVKLSEVYPLEDDGMRSIIFFVDTWFFEVIVDKNAQPTGESDADPDYVAKAVAAWTAWGEFIKDRDWSQYIKD